MFEKDIKEEAEKRCSKYFHANCYKENRWADTHDLMVMYLDGYNKAMKEWRDCFMSCSSPYCADKFRDIQCSGALGNMTKEEKRNEGMA